jgi:hypothetical protein
MREQIGANGKPDGQARVLLPAGESAAEAWPEGTRKNRHMDKAGRGGDESATDQSRARKAAPQTRRPA